MHWGLPAAMVSFTKNLSTSDKLMAPNCKFYPCEAPFSHQPDSIPPHLLPLQVLPLTAFFLLLASRPTLVTEFQLAFEVFTAGYPLPKQKRVQP